MTQVFIQCECKTEGLLVEYDRETDTFNASLMATSYHNFATNIWTRLKTIWFVLTRKNIYNDQIVLSKQNARELNKFFTQYGAEYFSATSFTIDELYQEHDGDGQPII